MLIVYNNKMAKIDTFVLKFIPYASSRMIEDFIQCSLLSIIYLYIVFGPTFVRTVSTRDVLIDN